MARKSRRSPVKRRSSGSKSRKGSRRSSVRRSRKGSRRGSVRRSRKGSRRGSVRRSRKGSRRGSVRRSRKGSRRGSVRRSRKGSARKVVSKQCKQKVNARNCSASELRELLHQKGLIVNQNKSKDQLLEVYKHPTDKNIPCNSLDTLQKDCSFEKLKKLYDELVKKHKIDLPKSKNLNRSQLYHILHSQKLKLKSAACDVNSRINDCDKAFLVKHILEKIAPKIKYCDLDYVKIEHLPKLDLIKLIKSWNAKKWVDDKFCLPKESKSVEQAKAKLRLKDAVKDLKENDDLDALLEVSKLFEEPEEQSPRQSTYIDDMLDLNYNNDNESEYNLGFPSNVFEV